jgi:hypothetical protein
VAKRDAAITFRLVSCCAMALDMTPKGPFSAPSRSTSNWICPWYLAHSRIPFLASGSSRIPFLPPFYNTLAQGFPIPLSSPVSVPKSSLQFSVLSNMTSDSTKRNTHFPGSSIFQQTIEPPRDGSSPKLPTSKWAGRRLRHGLESSHRIGYMTGKENLCFSSHIKGRLRPKNCASRERRDFPRKGLGIDLSDPGVTRGRTRQANCTHRHIRLLRAELRKCIENCMATRPM